ncbi:adenylate/guanylate cyclase domain-containing protein [Archangium sp.]|uniref:adenylate/guanylate cyclase domain-containing protein n=1 Tax=Archangium sp. TaxID=1872627 RepID=UPI002EDAC1B1
MASPGSLHPIAQWLLEQRSARGDAAELVAGFAERLLADGTPLWRLRMSVLAMHPELFGRAVHWQRGVGVSMISASHSIIASPSYQGSPVEAIHRGSGPIRCRIDGPIEALPYQQLAELRAQGGTDYFIAPLVFGDGRISFISCATDVASGFSDEQVRLFELLLPFLTVRLELESAAFSLRSLLQVYLGRNAAERVLSGQFKRGEGQVLRAAIWYCDLRGFTSLVDHTALDAVIPILDQYFECMARPVAEEGGEILKFVGDALLAVFVVGEDESDACTRAVRAARAALDGLARLEVARVHGLRAGVAVHLGEVMYGNIGASDRLDFTVIGAAVNEAARMESLCKELGVPLLISAEVAARAQGGALRSLGRHALRGVSVPRELFTEPAPTP